MKSGVVLIDKGPGMSSAAVVARLRRQLNGVKAGHCGTLDPMATGLLVCLTGNATKLASYAEAGRKTYSGTIVFGITTDSDDCTGSILTKCDELPDFDVIQSHLNRFTGSIQQLPPTISAIKVDGQRAYARARRGEDFELKTRSVEVYSLSVRQLGQRQISFRMECSKGTYVRSIARDLGQVLGCGACLTSLRREFSAPFSVENAKNVDFVGESDILDPQALFPNLEVVPVEEFEASRLAVGDERVLHDLVERNLHSGLGDMMLYGSQSSGKCLGLLVRRDSHWRFGVNLNS